VELGETSEEAVVREVEEEIGLQVEVVELVAVLDRIFLDSQGQVQYHYALMDFLCRKMGGRLQASSDVISCAQVPFAALTRYRLSKETREVINRARQRYHGGTPPIYKFRSLTSAD
jgi:ADP-ribose pyrophosphatase YjhB (NUDIX family)